MSRTKHSITSGMLELSNGKVLEVGSMSYFQALGSIDSFRFEGEAGTFTARKERPLKKSAIDTGSGEPEYSESASYWYGYRKVQGTTRKRYVGRTEDLTLKRLEEIAAALDVPSEQRLPPKVELPITDEYRLLENKLWMAQENCKSLQEENQELKAKLLQLESTQTDRVFAIDTWAVLNRLKKRYPKLTIDMVNAISREFSRTSKQKN